MFGCTIFILLVATTLATVKVVRRIDANFDGIITWEEAESYFESYDTNYDECINLEEFTPALYNFDPRFKGYETVLFSKLDPDSSGQISKAEFAAVYKHAGINKYKGVSKPKLYSCFSILLNLPAG